MTANAAENPELAEELRQRDILVQVERFLKYAAKGTAPEVLQAEAAEWSRRLAGFAGKNEGRAKQLREKLGRL